MLCKLLACTAQPDKLDSLSYGIDGMLGKLVACTARLDKLESLSYEREKTLEDLRVSSERLKADFEALSLYGATAEGGVDRPALGEAHLAAHDWLRRRIQADGLELRLDQAGNHLAFLGCGPQGAPALLLGSHLDSVPDGGRYDGALGVLAALETLRCVREAGLALPVNLEAIDFTDEEGTLVGLLGSYALAGRLKAADLLSPRGGRERLSAGLERAGLSEGGLLVARREPSSLAGYLELHIEQGPRLLQTGVQIGVVTSIVGICSYRLAFTGRADHAGTTPMRDRLDAAQGAAAFTLAVRQKVLQDFPECVANVGMCRLRPGAFNIVPGARRAGAGAALGRAGKLCAVGSGSVRNRKS